MIDSIVYAKLGELSEALHNCGWSVARSEKFSADTLAAMLIIDRGAERDRRAMDAARLLPQLGPVTTAERLGTCRSNVYKLVHHHRDKVHASSQA